MKVTRDGVKRQVMSKPHDFFFFFLIIIFFKVIFELLMDGISYTIFVNFLVGRSVFYMLL
jgi:hypothetical protein